MAKRRPNLSVYAPDGAVINGIDGSWQLGNPPNDQWSKIRREFWGNSASTEDTTEEFVLGDFVKLARFFRFAQAQQMRSDRDILTSDDVAAPDDNGHS